MLAVISNFASQKDSISLIAAKAYYESGQQALTLRALNSINLSSIGFKEREIWWKLKYDSDYDLGDIEAAKSDASSLQILREQLGLGDFYRCEYLARLASCYHFQVKADSAFNYSCQALDLFRKQKGGVTGLEAFRVYFAHAAATRNAGNDAYRLIFNRLDNEHVVTAFMQGYIKAMFDTAVSLCNSNFLLSKVYRSYGNFYLDYSDKLNSRDLELQRTCSIKAEKLYLKSNYILESKCHSPKGAMLYNYNLLGLLHTYNGNFDKAKGYFDKANVNINAILDDVNLTQSNRYFCLTTYRYQTEYLTRKYNIIHDTDLYRQCITMNIKAIQLYKAYLNGITDGHMPYRDTYGVNPFTSIVECNLKLYILSDRADYLRTALSYINSNKVFHFQRRVKSLQTSIDSTSFWSGLRSRIAENQAFLLYYDFQTGAIEKRSMVIVSCREKLYGKLLNIKSHTGYASISIKSNRIFSLLKDSSNQAVSKYLNAMSRSYFVPIRNLIPDDIEDLIIIPNYELTFLPFEILPLFPDDEKKSNQLIVNQFSVRYTNLLASTENISYPRLKTHVFDYTKNGAKVIYPFSSLAALKLSKNGDYFDNTIGDVNTFIDLCKSPESIIQVFSHAASNPNNLLKSLIKFGTDTLTSNQVYKERFRAPLLYLTACETSYGQYDIILGKFSLANDFLNAGIKAIIAAEWPIDDKAGATITERFYELLYDGFSASQALRLAKLEFIKNNPSLNNPLYWAALQYKGQDFKLKSINSYFVIFVVIAIITALLLLKRAFTIRKQ